MDTRGSINALILVLCRASVEAGEIFDISIRALLACQPGAEKAPPVMGEAESTGNKLQARTYKIAEQRSLRGFASADPLT